MIVGQNTLLNQYVPTFYIKDLYDGQILVFDSVRKAFVNQNNSGGGGGGATRLGELTDVSPSVDNPLSVQNGQSLIYNSFTGLWGNQFTDYNTLLNKPTSSSFSFAGLSDTAKPPLPNGYVLWNSTGTQLVYSTTIPGSSITGLATVAFTGNYNDLTNKPISGGSVTTVSVVSAAGVSGTVANPTTTPAITITLGNITPASVNALGLVLGSNLQGTNTGDQTAPSTQVVYGTGTGLTSTPNFTYNNSTGTLSVGSAAAALITADPGQTMKVASDVSVTLATNNIDRLVIAQTGAFNIAGSTGVNGQILTSNGPALPPTWQTIATGGGTVTSIAVTGNDGIGVTGSPITTSGTFNLTLGNITPTSILSTGTIVGSNVTGTNTGDQTITLTGDIAGSGTGSFATVLSASGVTAGTYINATITVDSKGRVISASNGTAGGVSSFNTRTGAITLTSGDVTTALGYTPGTGTVTSVALSGGTTGFSITGSPITTAGTITLSGTLSLTAGGTGATTQAGAANAILPPQTGHTGQFLTTNGTTVSWASVAAGSGTVTSISATGSNGIFVTGSPITTSGTLAFSLGAITPTSIAASGSISGSNFAGSVVGTNTGDQTITLIGDVTGSGTSTFPTTLSTTGVTANTYGSSTQVPVFTVDAKGRISSVTNTTITGSSSASPEVVVFHYSSGGSGNFTSVDAIFSMTSGVTATVTDGANCIATYAFTGRGNPPKSVTLYGQNFTANTFSIVGMPGPGAAAANIKIAGGGTSAAPDLANGIFSATNVVTLQTRMSDTGASAGLGQRAWLVVVFGF